MNSDHAGGAGHPDRDLVRKVRSEDLSAALDRVEFPILGWDAQRRITLANPAAADLVGLSLDSLIGTDVSAYASPAEYVRGAVAGLVAGRFEAMRTKRSVTTGAGESIDVCVTSRVVDIDNERAGVSVFVPHSELNRLGRNPDGISLDLVPVALGTAGEDWVVRAVSADIAELVCRPAADIVGTNLLDLMDADDADELRRASRAHELTPHSFPSVGVRCPDGSERKVCVLVAAKSEVAGSFNFALLGNIEDFFHRHRIASTSSSCVYGASAPK